MKKIVRREKENQMWEDRGEENKNCGKQRDSVNEMFKKKRINLCGFFKDKLLGKNLL